MNERLRIALLAGSLERGGSEKQLVYTATSLADSGCEVRVYCLAAGGCYAPVLAARMPVIPIAAGLPVARLIRLIGRLRRFAPHVVHSMHAFANLYAAAAARVLGAIEVGALRSDVAHCRAANGGWTRWLLRVPRTLVVNSAGAMRELADCGLSRPARVHLITNVIDCATEPRRAGMHTGAAQAVFAARLIAHKRGDRFLRALALARREERGLVGVVAGEGPEAGRLARLAAELGLKPPVLRFLGEVGELGAVLRASDMLVLSSDHEGAPNVILEAMAAGLPVLTTPAGDAPSMVMDGATGFVVPFEPVDCMAASMVRLARDPELRRRMGEAGRARAMQEYSAAELWSKLHHVYREAARRSRKPRILRVC